MALKSLGFSRGNLNLESLRIYAGCLSTNAEARICGRGSPHLRAMRRDMCGLEAAHTPERRPLAARHPPGCTTSGGQGEGIGGDASRDAPPIFPPFGCPCGASGPRWGRTVQTGPCERPCRLTGQCGVNRFTAHSSNRSAWVPTRTKTTKPGLAVSSSL